MLPVVLAQPVRLPARQAEARSSQGVELPPNLVERRAHVRRAGTDLIEPVNKECLAAPLGMVLRLEGQEVPGRDRAGIIPKRLALHLEGGRFAGAGIAHQHVDRLLPELLQGPGMPLPVLRPLAIPQ